MTRLVAIVGPTAIGKSALGLALALAFDGEIVSADSRQVYRGLDVGTAKPSVADRQRVRHHLIDIIDPDDAFSLALYQRQAEAAIADIASRGKLPLLVGGSGLYVRAITEGLSLPQVPPDPNLRAKLADRIAREGAGALHAELAALDPDGAARIDPRNQRRLIRALEVVLTTGLPFSSLGRIEPPAFGGLLTIGLTTERADLYRRIDERVEQQIADGLVDEVRRLHDAGYGWELPAMSSLGYRQIGEHLRGECDLSTAIRRTKTQTHRFARQQYAWFRTNDARIHWLDVRGEVEASATSLVERWLQD